MRKIFLVFTFVFYSVCAFATQRTIQVLSIAPVFSNDMVLQRNKPVKFFGKGAEGAKIEVSFLNKTIKAVTDSNGDWQTEFPATAAGGPYTIQISDGQNTISLNNILIGDVWLCSGQSNMDFSLKASKTGAEELKTKSFNPQIRVLHRAGIVSTYNTAWDSTTLEKVNRSEYFAGNWESLNETSAASFSAVGYYFGKKVATEQNVPIGLIQVAVGGSPTESWVGTKRLEQEPQLAGIVKDYEHSDYVMPWCRERIGQNLVHARNKMQLHPFQPGYNFKAGILPLVQLPIAGVIWYQGESNAHNVAGHARIFETLVSDWRQKWGYQFPFYYVQLSSIERPLWPEFRDSQRQLLSQIPNSGMAVSLDLGDSLDVHPTRKKEIGDRLALLALSGYYKQNIVSNGPLPKRAARIKNNILVEFAKKEKLLTPDHKALIGFELVDLDGKNIAAQAAIRGDKVEILVPTGKKIKSVRYAYQPFTRANLMNEAGLPASTFSIDVK